MSQYDSGILEEDPSTEQDKPQDEGTQALVEMLMMETGRVFQDRSQWEAIWSKIAHYTLPYTDQMSPFANVPQGVQWQRDIYDNTATLSNQLFASALDGRLTPRGIKWGMFETNDPKTNNDPEAKGWLETASNIVLAVVTNSNFNEQAHEVYSHLGSFGTGALYVEADPETLVRFEAIHVAQYGVREDAHRRVNGFFRIYKMTYRQLEERFGAKALSVKMRKGVKERADDEIVIHHIVVPRIKKNPRKSRFAKSKRFASYWISCDDKWLLSESGYDSFPFAVTRLNLQPGEKMGRGPGMMCLSDIVMSNAISETMIRQAQLQAAPPIVAPNDNVIRLYPGGVAPNAVYYVKDMNQAPRPLLANAAVNLESGMRLLEQRQKAIRDAYFVDIILTQDAKYETAEALIQRKDERSQIYSALVGRINNEMLGVILLRVLTILMQIPGIIPPMPPSVAARKLNVRFVSPYARQQRYGEISAANQMIQLYLPIAQANPQMNVLDKINFDNLIEDTADVLGVQQNVLRTNDDADAIRKQRQDQQMRMQTASMIPGVAQSFESLSKAEKNTQDTNGLVGSLLKGSQ